VSTTLEMNVECFSGKRKEERNIAEKNNNGRYVLLSMSVVCLCLKILTCGSDHKFIEYVLVNNTVVVSKSVKAK
jgi:hypothetical protein